MIGERRIDELSDRLCRGIRHRVELARRTVQAVGGTIDALSPLKVLSRGYSLTRRDATKEIVRRASDARIGERIETILSEGRLTSVVERMQE